MLLFAVVFLPNAETPRAVLDPPVVFASKDQAPIAIFSAPVVFDSKAL